MASNVIYERGGIKAMVMNAVYALENKGEGPTGQWFVAHSQDEALALARTCYPDTVPNMTSDVIVDVTHLLNGEIERL